MYWTDLIQRIRDLTGLDAHPVASVERRRAWRVARRVNLIATLPAGDELPLLTRNLSPEGLRVESTRRLPRGQTLLLRVSRPPEEQGAAAHTCAPPQARVLWARQRKGQAGYDLGLELVVDSETARESVGAFLLHDCELSSANPLEHRSVPRVSGAMRGLLLQPDCRTLEVQVLDLSASGARVQSSREQPRGSTVSLKAFLPGGPQEGLLFQGEVVRTIRVAPRTYEFALAFTDITERHRALLVRLLSKRLQQRYESGP